MKQRRLSGGDFDKLIDSALFVVFKYSLCTSYTCYVFVCQPNTLETSRVDDACERGVSSRGGWSSPCIARLQF